MIKPDFKNSTPLVEDDGTGVVRNKSYIYLTGGGFIDKPVIGTGVDSKYGWQELTWKKTPSRSNTFAFTNMDDIEVGLIARCEFNIKYLNLQDYQDLRKIFGRERHFYATFFDMDDNKWIFNREVYCSENTLSKFFSLKQSFIGGMDYVIKLVGTNRDIDGGKKINVNYIEASELTTLPTAKTVTVGSQVELASAPNGFIWEDRDENGKVLGQYNPNQSITLWSDINLYLKSKN